MAARKAQESQKEMKLLLDMYKSAPKEQRDKVQLMAAERKSKAEVRELRGRARELEERERRESKKLADEEALRRLRQAEEQIEHLQRKLAATKQEEEALLSEMDVTGQAFEDMQEQNLRLLQQLREKDDANFKLMSERIKANQIHKLLREEKDELAEQVLALKAQVGAQGFKEVRGNPDICGVGGTKMSRRRTRWWSRFSPSRPRGNPEVQGETKMSRRRTRWWSRLSPSRPRKNLGV
uniref:E3 ubiquitin protein ligase n=1 Tax=Strix occidentalis caurina TaxID=311401 RepID=A0A8D0KS13_STROC